MRKFPGPTCSEACLPGLTFEKRSLEPFEEQVSNRHLPSSDKGETALCYQQCYFHRIGFELWKQLNCALYFTHYGTQIVAMGRILFLFMTLTDLIFFSPCLFGESWAPCEERIWGIQEQPLREASSL